MESQLGIWFLSVIHTFSVLFSVTFSDSFSCSYGAIELYNSASIKRINLHRGVAVKMIFNKFLTIFVLIASRQTATVLALNNGLAITPQMGWVGSFLLLTIHFDSEL